MFDILFPCFRILDIRSGWGATYHETSPLGGFPRLQCFKASSGFQASALSKAGELPFRNFDNRTNRPFRRSRHFNRRVSRVPGVSGAFRPSNAPRFFAYASGEGRREPRDSEINPDQWGKPCFAKAYPGRDAAGTALPARRFPRASV